ARRRGPTSRTGCRRTGGGRSRASGTSRRPARRGRRASAAGRRRADRERGGSRRSTLRRALALAPPTSEVAHPGEPSAVLQAVVDRSAEQTEKVLPGEVVRMEDEHRCAPDLGDPVEELAQDDVCELDAELEGVRAQQRTVVDEDRRLDEVERLAALEVEPAE